MSNAFQTWIEQGGKFPRFNSRDVYRFAEEKINLVKESFDNFISFPNDKTIYAYTYHLSEAEKIQHYLDFFETQKTSFKKLKVWFKNIYSDGVKKEHRQTLTGFSFNFTTNYQKRAIVEIYKNLDIYKTNNQKNIDAHKHLSDSINSSYNNSIEKMESEIIEKISNHIENKKINLIPRVYNVFKEKKEEANHNYKEKVYAFLNSKNRLNNYQEAIHFWADNDEKGIIQDLFKAEEAYSTLQKKMKEKIISNSEFNFPKNTLNSDWFNFSSPLFDPNNNEIEREEFLWKISIPKIVFHFLSQFGWNKNNNKKEHTLKKFDTNNHYFEFNLKNVENEEMVLRIKVNSEYPVATLLEHENEKMTGLIWLGIPANEKGLNIEEVSFLIHELTHIVHFADNYTKNLVHNDTIQLIPNDAAEFPTSLAERLILDPHLLSFYSSNKGGGKKISYWQNKIDSMNKHFYNEIETFYSYFHELILKSSTSVDDYHEKINNVSGYQNLESIPNIKMDDFNISTLYLVNRIMSEEMAPTNKQGYTNSKKIFSLIKAWIEGCGNSKSKTQYRNEWKKFAGKGILESRSSAIHNHINILNNKKI